MRVKPERKAEVFGALTAAAYVTRKWERRYEQSNHSVVLTKALLQLSYAHDIRNRLFIAPFRYSKAGLCSLTHLLRMRTAPKQSSLSLEGV